MKYKGSFFTLYLAILLFLADCYNTDIVIIFTSISLLYFIMKYGIYKKAFIMIFPLFVIVIIGMITAFLKGNLAYRDTLRDIYKTLCPIIFILFGFYLYEYEKAGKNYFWKSILIAGYLITFRHFTLIILNVVKYGISFETVRGVGGNMSMTTLISFVALTYLKDKLVFIPNKKFLFSKILLGLSLVLYLSRTMIVVLLSFLTVLSVNYIRKSSRKKILVVLFVSILFLFFFLSIRNTDIIIELNEKFSKSFTEINSKNRYWDWISINNNWRGYEVFLVKNEMNNTNILSKFFGFGFGARLSLGVTIRLGEELFSAVPILHNGYYYIFFKTGYVGLLMLLSFFFTRMIKVFRKILYSKKDKNNLLFLICTYIAIAISMYVISGFYNGVTLLSLCEVVGYYERKIADGKE